MPKRPRRPKPGGYNRARGLVAKPGSKKAQIAEVATELREKGVKPTPKKVEEALREKGIAINLGTIKVALQEV